MTNHLRAELVLDALEMAVGQRQLRDVIHHSDQGSQYTSLAFGKWCEEAGVRLSMAQSATPTIVSVWMLPGGPDPAYD